MPKNGVQKNPKVGFISRIDYGSSGFRKAIVESCFEICKREGTHFNVMSGLVDRDYSKKVKEFVVLECEKDKEHEKKRKENEGLKDPLKHLRHLTPQKRIAARKKELEEKYHRGTAKVLSNIIPILKTPDPENPKKEKIVDLFIVPSPAFDGEKGEKVANYLEELRSDIRVWNAGGDRFLVKYVDKTFWALAPRKAVWMRGDYYSTAAERVIKDKIKATKQKKSPDLFVVFCFGSSINKPKGELKYQYVTVPNASIIEETRVNENQIGLKILEFPLDGSQYLSRNYDLKDTVSNELGFIVPPPRASQNQKKIIEIIKSRGWATPGMLKYYLNLSDKQVAEQLEMLMRKKTVRRKGENWPGLTELSGKKYYFDLGWIQNNLKYVLPNGDWNEDTLVNFACFHGGSIETDYLFFKNELPQIILRRGANMLIAAGDEIEGMEHDLDRKQELIPGMNNYTIQEKFTANAVGVVIMQVFEERFNALLKSGAKEKLGIAGMLEKSLLNFRYIPGNHDDWVKKHGFIPLDTFHSSLVRFLAKNIETFLVKIGAPIPNLYQLVEAHVKQQDIIVLPSKLRVKVQHPGMARAKTTSIRPQEMLDFGKRENCQISIGGNFHVSENLEEWDIDMGQCVSMEIGTIKHGSNFERGKLKIVDQGVGVLRVLSKDSRVFMSESVFYGGPRVRPINNFEWVNEFIEGKLGIPPIEDYRTQGLA